MNNPKRILIVDDDPNVLQLYGAILKKEGYEVSVAEKKQQIIKEIEKEGIDLLLVDLILPDIESSEVIDKFIRRNKEAKIILITGYPNLISSIEYMQKDYIYEYLTKPINGDKLVEVIGRALIEEGAD